MSEREYIYIHTKECSDYECQDTEDMILNMSTDFKQIMDKIDYTKNWYESQIIIAENGNFDNHSIIMFYEKNIVQSLKSYTPLALLNDKEELEYVCSVLEEWINKRTSYLSEEKMKKDAEEKRKQEEKDRKEYERLKKKFEKTNI